MVERNSPGDQNNHDGGSYLLFEELERAKCRIEERDDLIKELKATLETMVGAEKKPVMDRSALNLTIDQLHKDNIEMELLRYKRENKVLLDFHSDQKVTITKLENMLRELNEQHEQVLDAYEKEKDKTMRQSEDLQKLDDLIKGFRSGETKTIQELQSKIESIKKSKEQLESNHKQELSSLKTEIARMKAELSSERKSGHQISNDLMERCKRLPKLQQNGSQNPSPSQVIEILLEEINYLSHKVELHKTQSKNQEEEIRVLRETINSQTQEFDIMQKKVSRLEAASHDLRRQEDSVRKIKDLRRTIGEQEEVIKSLKGASDEFYNNYQQEATAWKKLTEKERSRVKILEERLFAQEQNFEELNNLTLSIQSQLKKTEDDRNKLIFDLEVANRNNQELKQQKTREMNDMKREMVSLQSKNDSIMKKLQSILQEK